MKKTVLFTFALVMALSLAACGKTETAGNTGKANESVVVEETKNKEMEEETERETEEETTIDQIEIKADSLDTLEEIVNKDVEDTIAVLAKKYGDLVNELDTYDKYKENVEKVEDFYGNVLTTQKDLNIRLREYAVAYAEMILASDGKYDEKYDEMEEMYDVIYDEVGEDVYDNIYDGCLEDMYDAFYDGILDEAYDTVEYSEWLDLRSEEYEWWLDTRSDIYEDWLDFRSEVYEFWLDVRSELFEDDIEKATEKVEDFKADIAKLKEK